MRLLNSPAAAKEQADQEQDYENNEQDFCDPGRSRGDTRKAENSGDNRDYQKHQRPMQHSVLSPVEQKGSLPAIV